MTLRTIVVAASKGGVGKTTITAALAVQATKDGKNGNRVAMIDWEPQGSLTFWNVARGKPANPALIPGAPDPVETARHLAATGSCDFLFVDTPPSGVDAIERAIEAADFVLIPAQSSFFDLAAIRVVAALCQEAHKPYAFVFNEHDPRRRALNESARKVLASIGGHVIATPIEDRAAYVSALNSGKTGPEHPDKRQREPAASEIEAVWTEIKALMRKAGAK